MQLNDFAHSIGISPAYWSRIEREMEKPPKDELIIKAASLLNENIDEAFIAAGRLPPDMRGDLRQIVNSWRSGVLCIDDLGESEPERAGM